VTVAVLIPCHNEETSIYTVIQKIGEMLPAARIVVCDNASTDRTAEQAKAAGAEVIEELQKGKGNAMRRLFRDVDADVYIMIDGDNTYGTEIIPEAIKLVQYQGCDMVVGSRRLHEISQRRGHNFGNQLFTRFFKIAFGVKSDDVFSGLRVLSKRLVKTFPCISLEFEIEAELEIYCARMHLPTASLPVQIRSRKGSVSKLNTWRDGTKILWLALRMFHREYPLRLYATLAAVIMAGAIILLAPLLYTYLLTGLVPRFPTLIVGAAMFAISFSCLAIGLLLKEITNNRYESRYLRYLSFPTG
jgi:glycosyltransferase involved in cell wall biosynthesis